MSTISNALYSATYNPEAQKALADQQANNTKSQNSLQEILTKVKAQRISAGELTTNANTKLDSLIAAAEKAIATTSNTDKDFIAAQNILTTGATSIFNQQTGAIKQNYLDAVSEMLGGDFNALYSIYTKNSRRR